MDSLLFLALLLSPVAAFLTKNDALNFAVLGDFGGIPRYPYESNVEHAVASRLGAFCRERGCHFFMELGDNFYDDGVRNVDDPRFEQTFEHVFRDSSLQTPWYVVAGNHDHHGNVSAQIAYTKKSHRWNFPDLYYSVSIPIPHTDHSVDLVMLDTVTLCGRTRSDSHPDPPPGPADRRKAESQWTWLEEKLTNSRARYLIVAGHYPVWSIAEHGPTSCLVDKLRPLLHKYRATSYMCGHDHNLQHLQHHTDGHTVDYFVVGSASKIDSRTSHRSRVPSGSLKFHEASSHGMGGFAYVQATESSMKLTFVGSHGTLLHTQEMPPRF